MNMRDDIKRITDYFKGRDEVSALYIFGSASNNKETSESDIDIAVLINDRKKGRKTYESLKKTYYSVSPGFSLRPIDIVVLNTAPPFLKHRIIKTGKVLFDRNRRLRVRFAANAIIEYFDYKPIEDICLKAVAGRFRRARVG
ncbi:MAG: nucleotidyltransferase domain-containing protein [Nitrospirae bacterium]|nr:nucleotidyltransferase domain-containing protein [Nitrospirota bacterium]MCL5976645.1 nucleotidyltransferase domain-containing protein [Nitrospirota bacterium]